MSWKAKMSIGSQAVETVSKCGLAFCRFLTANDTGQSGAHQSGIYISKQGAPILFNRLGVKGEQLSRMVTIKWNDDFITDGRFIYYGQKTRNEYRITRMGRNFPYLSPEHTGDLFVLAKQDEDYYLGYVLEFEDDINEFLGAFGMMPSDTGKLIEKQDILPEVMQKILLENYIGSLTVDFPISSEISSMARKFVSVTDPNPSAYYSDPDGLLLKWTDMEFKLFRELEINKYSNFLNRGFSDIDSFIKVSLEIINRRKSRAGKSFEHHLSALFHGNFLKFEEQVNTEEKKKPDFIFPGGKEYHDYRFPSDKLVFLGAKTTCKDRWRQILSEADRIPVKHLCTLQQGISAPQLQEMKTAGVKLVVPAEYIKTYPKEFRSDIWTLSEFIGYVQEKQED